MNGPGIIKSDSWIMTADGDEYLYVWSPHWKVINDKGAGEMLGLESFRSTEKWQLLGYVGAELRLVIPGCQVKSWMACDDPPKSKKILVLK